MYSVKVHTSDSTADYGTNIATTEKLKEFLCALNMQLVTYMEVNYYRELGTGQIPIVIPEAIQPANEQPITNEPLGPPNKPSDWEPDNMGLPL